jgi:signal transduction histidine kinase
MGHLTDDMLRLARIARSEVSRDDVNISQLTREVVSQAQSIRARTGSCHRSRLKAIGDRHLLRAVLENLLGNAWKYVKAA